MKLIYQHENMMVLHSVKNILALNHIDCSIKNEYGHTMGPEFGLPNTLLELYLTNANDYDKALAIIDEQILNANTDEPWTCTQCNEDNDGNYGKCWKCQNERVEE